MNGRTHSILRVLDHLQDRGDDVLVIAPSTQDGEVPDRVKGAEVHRLPAVPLTGYTNVRVAMGGVYRVKRILADYAPGVVHLASPVVLGRRAARAAHQLGTPTVAVYETEVPGCAARYGVPFLENWAWKRVDNIHLLASRPLGPCTFALNQLRGRGIPRIQMWWRGVDTERFSPLASPISPLPRGAAAAPGRGRRRRQKINRACGHGGHAGAGTTAGGRLVCVASGSPPARCL